MVKVDWRGSRSSAEGGEGMGFGEEVSPFPMGRGLERGLCPLPENFLIFCFGMLHFGCNLMHFRHNKACTK